MVERSQRVRLTATELSDQSQDGGPVFPVFPESRRRVIPAMLIQSTSETGPREELGWVSVVLRRRSGDDLLQSDGELVGTK